jgi:1-acyl-sn-glycerol-3-phosphate acyltransferase
MGRLIDLNYAAATFLGRWIYALSIKGEVLRPALAERPGGYVLAVTHLSHLEPFVVGTLVRRKIDWMARVEFFRNRVARRCLYAMDAFPVNRFGVPVSAVRTAIARGRAGRVVGIFPEGGVVHGPASACRGGPVKQGACLVAARAGIPVVPCVVLGTHALNEIEPWLPFRRARLWVAFGEPIEPPPMSDAPPVRKAARQVMSRQLGDAFCALYAELRARYDIPDSAVP